MRIERINENSIRCTLTSFDLSVRNLNLRELAYGSEKARKLFEEMMSKASSEVGFNAENTPIMIEAIPMSSDSIQLIISKVANPDELDTRFSKFTQNPALKKEAENWINKLASALLEGADGFAEQLKQLNQGAADTAPAGGDAERPETESGPDTVIEHRAFSFDELDTVIRAAETVRGCNVCSTLYKSPIDSRYVLLINNSDISKEDFAKACNVFAEYGRMIKTVQDTAAYYAEHYKFITGPEAVTKLGQL